MVHHVLIAQLYLLDMSSLQMSLISRSEFHTNVMIDVRNIVLLRVCFLQNVSAGCRAHSAFCSVCAEILSQG